jgi:hypothetical protein
MKVMELWDIGTLRQWTNLAVTLTSFFLRELIIRNKVEHTALEHLALYHRQMNIQVYGVGKKMV